jgi:hypothetical protein
MKTCGDYKQQPMTKNNPTMSNHMALLASENYAFWQCIMTPDRMLHRHTPSGVMHTRHIAMQTPRLAITPTRISSNEPFEMTNHGGRDIFIFTEKVSTRRKGRFEPPMAMHGRAVLGSAGRQPQPLQTKGRY